MRLVALCTVLVGVLIGAPVATPASAAGNYPPVPRGSYTGCVGLKRPSPPLTAAQMAHIEQKILAQHPGDVDSGAPCPGGPVIVKLVPGREWLARQLQGQFGSELAIFVGLTAWHGRPGKSPVCGTLPVVPDRRDNVALSLHLDTTTVSSGSNFTGTVALINKGPRPFEADIGQPLLAMLVKVGSNRVVGIFSGGTAGTGLRVRLAPRRSETIRVRGGTARCDGGTGSALPPGLYGVTVLVRDENASLPGEVPFSAYVSPAHPLRVVTAKGPS